MTFEGHVCCWHIDVIGWQIKVAIFLVFSCMCSNVGFMCRLCYWSHDQKCHVASHFDHLDPRNAVLPVMMMFAIWYADARSNGVM